MKGRRGADHSGKIFGRLTAISHVGKGQGNSKWLCTCLCGNQVIVATHSLVRGATKSCGCLQENNAKARRISIEEKKKRRAEAAKIKQQTPERKDQKLAAQMRYAVSDKALLASFRRWTSKRKNKIEITDEEYLQFRLKPCTKCGKKIEGLGICFLLIKPRGLITISNMVPTCGICKLIKPKNDFNPIAFTKAIIRRFWKKTPMASIAKQKARKGRGLYECAVCNVLFKKKETHIDHIQPVIDPTIGYIDLETYVARLLCDESNLQIICKKCHLDKTSKENEIRQKTKKEGKK